MNKLPRYEVVQENGVYAIRDTKLDYITQHTEHQTVAIMICDSANEYDAKYGR